MPSPAFPMGTEDALHAGRRGSNRRNPHPWKMGTARVGQTGGRGHVSQGCFSGPCPPSRVAKRSPRNPSFGGPISCEDSSPIQSSLSREAPRCWNERSRGSVGAARAWVTRQTPAHAQFTQLTQRPSFSPVCPQTLGCFKGSWEGRTELFLSAHWFSLS